MSDLVLSGDFTDFNDSAIPLGITMRNHTLMGEVNGLGKVELSAIEVVDVDNRTINYYVQFSVTSSSGQGRTGNSTLSLEATSKIVAAIDRLKLSTSSMTKFKNFQASYKGDANFQITAFSDKNQKIVFSIDAENVSAYLMQVSQLGDLRKGIVKTLSYIEENRVKPAGSSF